MQDLKANNKTVSYNVHDHDPGNITITNSTFNVDGGHIPSPKDNRIQGLMKNDGSVNHPSAVLGTLISNVITQNNAISTMSQQSTITYYTENPAQNTTVDYQQFKTA